MVKELELTFHDSIPMPEEQLPKARDKAAKQKELVLDFFRQRFSMNFTPIDVFNFLNDHITTILLTSVRRSITDLTKEGRLIKCQWSESRQGAYGKLNRVWTYNRNFLNRLNSNDFSRPEIMDKLYERYGDQSYIDGWNYY